MSTTIRRAAAAIGVLLLSLAIAPQLAHADAQVNGTLLIQEGAAPESWCNAVTILDGSATRTVNGTLTIGCPDPVGATCTGNGDCLSGSCADGVCCSSACNQGCGSCNVAGHVGTCWPRVAGTSCRGSAGVCDAAEVCNGSATTCPADAPAPAGQVCRPDSGAGCDVADACGGNFTCPADGFRAAGSQCRANNGGGCDVAETCSGGSPACPGDGGVAAGTVCRAISGQCDLAEVCTGGPAACPSNQFASAGTECGNGACDTCDSSGTCTAQGTACLIEQFHHTDPLGTVVATTDASGGALCQEDHEPFGELRSTSAGCGDRKFNGRVFDEGTGFYDYGARSYDPRVGRFASADLAPGQVDNLQSQNRYIYVLNNPFKFTDPSGHQPQCSGPGCNSYFGTGAPLRDPVGPSQPWAATQPWYANHRNVTPFNVGQAFGDAFHDQYGWPRWVGNVAFNVVTAAGGSAVARWGTRLTASAMTSIRPGGAIVLGNDAAVTGRYIATKGFTEVALHGSKGGRLAANVNGRWHTVTVDNLADVIVMNAPKTDKIVLTACYGGRCAQQLADKLGRVVIAANDEVRGGSTTVVGHYATNVWGRATTWVAGKFEAYYPK